MNATSWRGVLGGVVLLCSCGSGDDEAVLGECRGGADTVPGSTHGVDWIALNTYEDADVVLACERLCTRSARCLDYDEDSCLSECGGVLEQARQQRCEQSLVDAMECLERNLCDVGLPKDPAEGDPFASFHPCALPVAAASCSILTETDQPTVFEVFSGEADAGISLVASQGATNLTNHCARSFMSQASLLSIDCKRTDDSPWCCVCTAQQEPVRGFVAGGQACPLGDLDSPMLSWNLAVCGWRY